LAGIFPRLRFASRGAGWRGLGIFWVIVILLLAAGAATLQVLGPPAQLPPRPLLATAQAPHPVVAPPTAAPPPVQQPPGQARTGPHPGRDTPGPIADPDPALLDPVIDEPNNPLPRIAIDGRMPMQVYAAGVDQSTRRPKVGLLLAGVGLNQAESDAAVRTLPGGITLAFSPYAPNPTKLLAAARLAEHEYLVSLPMEPQGFPINDPGAQAMMANLSPEQNHQRLEWAMSRIAGYVGATGALGTTRGERFVALPDQMNPVLTELAKRGLLYVDARPDTAALPIAWGRGIDVVIDEPATPAEIDDNLGRLAKLAHKKGSALGLATAVRPVTVNRIANWANGLEADGLTLAPVSALAKPPAVAK
jgi:polysaccharide deacetylase 2 family uncharacterized protein YibQ